jgi:hypothetical protein
MTVREANGHANHMHEIRDALPAFQAEEAGFTTVITDVPDEGTEEAMFENVNGVAHAPGEK